MMDKSRINGHFSGCEEKRVFHLQNGDAWQQQGPKYRYMYRYRPRAKIWIEADRFYLDVEGMHELIPVRRV